MSLQYLRYLDNRLKHPLRLTWYFCSFFFFLFFFFLQLGLQLNELRLLLILAITTSPTSPTSPTYPPCLRGTTILLPLLLPLPAHYPALALLSLKQRPDPDPSHHSIVHLVGTIESIRVCAPECAIPLVSVCAGLCRYHALFLFFLQVPFLTSQCSAPS